MEDIVENVVEEVVETAKRVSLWDKRADELTVGESIKLSLAVPVVMIGGMLIIAGTISAKDAIKARLEKRRHDKMEQELQKMAKVKNWVMWKKKLEEFWNENPVQAVALGALALTAVAKFIDAVGSARSRNAYARMAQQSVRRRR